MSIKCFIKQAWGIISYEDEGEIHMILCSSMRRLDISNRLLWLQGIVVGIHGLDGSEYATSLVVIDDGTGVAPLIPTPPVLLGNISVGSYVMACCFLGVDADGNLEFHADRIVPFPRDDPNMEILWSLEVNFNAIASSLSLSTSLPTQPLCA